MASKHRALGKGLSALIPSRTKELITKEGYFLCPVSKINVNEHQPRRTFYDNTIDELAQSIKENGILQPIVVKPHGTDYQLIAGERRLRAAKRAGLKEVPVIVKDVDGKGQLLFSLIENLQREDINPIDEADGFRRLVDDFGLSQGDVAKKVGKDRATIANSIRLLRLPGDVQTALKNGSISPGHARAILSIENIDEQIKLFRKIVGEKLTVRAAESYAKLKKVKHSHDEQSSEVKIQIDAIEDELRRLFTTKIKLHFSNQKGRLEIHYNSLDDLDRILNIIRNK